MGIAWVVSPAYVGEMASPRIRGQLGLMVQLCYAGGLLFAYAAGWLLNDYTSLAVTSASVSVASCVLFQFLPESPYFLMLSGRSEAAARSLSRLRSYDDEEQLQAELAVVKDSVLNDRYGIRGPDDGFRGGRRKRGEGTIVALPSIFFSVETPLTCPPPSPGNVSQTTESIIHNIRFAAIRRSRRGALWLG